MSSPIIKLTPQNMWPAPGVYADIPFTQYATLPACNASMLKALAGMTPAKALYYVRNHKTTKARAEGITLHTFLLEPRRFSMEYPIARPCQAVLASGVRKGSACGADSAEWTGAGGWLCGKHREGQSLSKGIPQEFYDRLCAAHKEIHRVAGEVFAGIEAGTTLCELTLIWVDPDTELLCKCRLDLFEPVDKRITDIKKCRSADPEFFGGDVGTFNYHVQDAWYCRGARACFGRGIYDFRFIAVELNENECNGAQLLELDQEARSVGEAVAQRTFEVYADAIRAEKWAGYSADIKQVSLRPWAIRREDILNGSV